MQDECRLHLAVADEALEESRALLAAGQPRGASSRSYYAMFHAGQALLRSLGKHSKTHRGLLDQLRLHGVSPDLLDRADLQALHQVMEAREASDYDIISKPDPHDAELWLARAGAG